MGRQTGQKGWQGQWNGDGAGHGHSQYWDYWHGAWPSKWDKPKETGKNGGKGAATKEFPRYSDMKIPKDHAKDGDAGGAGQPAPVEVGDPKQDFLKALQRALNSSRKLEARARKLAEDKQRKEQLWEEYQHKLKTSYLEQLQIYDSDMQKLDAEIAQVKIQKEEAIANVTSLAEAGEAPMRMQVELQRPVTREQEDSWEKLLATKPWEAVENPWDNPVDRGAGPSHQVLRDIRESTASQDEMFRAKLRAMQMEIAELKDKSAATDSVLQAVCTPERRPKTGLNITPQPTSRRTMREKSSAAEGSNKFRRVEVMANAPSPECYVGGRANLIKDPYMVSPSGQLRPPPLEPTLGEASFGPVRSVKRSGATQAEGPLNGPGVTPATTSGSKASKAKPPPQILDDDGDELECQDDAPSDASNDLTLME